MKKRREDNNLEAFNGKASGEGITYAQAQMRETYSRMERIRVPQDSDAAYMKVSARNTLKKLERTGHTGGNC